LREIGGFEVPTSVVGNNNETAIRSLALANRSLKETAKRLNWPGLTVRATLSTVASQEEYALPSDFQSLINQTIWDDTNNLEVSGPVSASDWEYLQNSDTAASTSSISTWFRILRGTSSNNKLMYLFPIPDSVRTLRYEYKSDALTETSGNVLQGDKYIADTDVSIVDEDIVALGFKWRFLMSHGLPYVEEFRDYEVAIETGASAYGAPIIDLSARTIRRTTIIVPEGDFG